MQRLSPAQPGYGATIPPSSESSHSPAAFAAICQLRMVVDRATSSVAKDRSWFGDDYVPFESFATGLIGTSKMKVVGVGSVTLPVKTSPNKIGHKSHGKLVLKNVLHIPSSVCNIIGSPILDDYNLNMKPSEASMGTIIDLNGKAMAYFKPARQSQRFELRLSGPPIGPRLGPSPFDPSAHYFIHALWPESEKARFDAFRRAPPSVRANDVEKKYNPEDRFADSSFDENELTWIESNWGNSHNFMISYGLKFYKNEDCLEAKSLVHALMHADDDDEDDDDEDDDESDEEAGFADHLFDETELDWIRSNYGTSTKFMISHGLKLHREQDCEEAKSLVRVSMHGDESEEEADFANHVFFGKELDWVRSNWGTSTNFMINHGLKFYKNDDCEEAQAIVRTLMREDDDIYEAAMTVLRSRMANKTVPRRDLAEAQDIIRAHMTTKECLKDASGSGQK